MPPHAEHISSSPSSSRSNPTAKFERARRVCKSLSTGECVCVRPPWLCGLCARFLNIYYVCSGNSTQQVHRGSIVPMRRETNDDEDDVVGGDFDLSSREKGESAALTNNRASNTLGTTYSHMHSNLCMQRTENQRSAGDSPKSWLRRPHKVQRARFSSNTQTIPRPSASEISFGCW